MYYGFQKLFPNMLQNFRNNGLDLIGSNIVLLVIVDKFDPNLVLVNINKLKPYKFIEDRTLQPVLTKLNDLATNELVQSRELEPLPIELKDLQLVGFELVSNHLTPRSF
jgi:hypothetical protein